MLMAPGVPLLWRTARGALSLDRPVVVAILNATPDSFWDGGRYASTDAAVRRAGELLEAGADIVDVGGESTRPGAAPVAGDDEVRRVVPAIEGIVRQWPHAVLSVDTVKAQVARAAIDAGAAIINDVSGLRLDPALGTVAAATHAGLILMHSRGDVATMASYELATYGDDVMGDVVSEMTATVDAARRAGVNDDALVIDPGLGFSKRSRHSVAVLAQLHRLGALGLPILVGPSRKRFIGDAAGGLPPEQRGPGTIAACVLALQAGARIFRVHDAAEVRRALDLAWAVMNAAGGD
ncbi:MAG TPA: dihydropteroate synthase [Longimicrobiales bacterium]|nr:dihydropteroate synthase [Longimicrobiales bacterium]